MSTIGVDIDGTLYDWTAAVNQAVMNEFGCEDPGEHKTWDHLKEFLGNDGRWRWIWSKEASPSVFGAEGFLYPGCQEVVNDLCRRHDVHFCTHRNPAKTGATTALWLAEHFEGYKGLHVLDNSVKKYQVYDWDIFIDDKVETIQEFDLAANAEVLMPARDWNAHHRPDHVHVFEDWADVPALVAAIAEGD